MVLITGFKGKNNSSGVLAEQISSEHLLLTNSFVGLRKDIDSINKEYDLVVMFGIDTKLASSVRIEKLASIDNENRNSALDLNRIAVSLNTAGLSAIISESPTACLCNAAYWHMLDRFSGSAVFIHIPPLKYTDEDFVNKIKTGLQYILPTYDQCR